LCGLLPHYRIGPFATASNAYEVHAVSEPIYRERLAARRALLERAVARIVDICRAIEDVRAAYVFGSFVRDSIRLRSDLDVLIVRDTPLRRAERDLDIRRAFDVPLGLDLLVVTPQEYAEQLPSTSFGRTIVAEALCVYAA